MSKMILVNRSKLSKALGGACWGPFVLIKIKRPPRYNGRSSYRVSHDQVENASYSNMSFLKADPKVSEGYLYGCKTGRFSIKKLRSCLLSYPAFPTPCRRADYGETE